MRRGSGEIIPGAYLIGGPNVTGADDAAVYLIDFGSDLVLIDAGAGGSASQLVRNIEMLGLNPALVSHVILTHCHIDHIGAAPPDFRIYSGIHPDGNRKPERCQLLPEGP